MNIFFVLYGLLMFGLLCMALYYNWKGTRPLSPEVRRRCQEYSRQQSTK